MYERIPDGSYRPTVWLVDCLGKELRQTLTQAEIASQYLRKGSPVFIEGRLRQETWTDKTSGQKRSKLSVVGENLQLLRSVNDDPFSVPPRGPVSQRTAPARAPSVEPEDVPF